MIQENRKLSGDSIRRHARIRVCVRALFRIEGIEGKRLFHAESINLSNGGVCLKMEENKKEMLSHLEGIPPGIQLSLALIDNDLPDGEYPRTTWIDSRIRWFLTPTEPIDPLVLGMEYVELGEINSRKIDEFTTALILRRREAIYRKRIKSVLGGKQGSKHGD